MSTMTKASVTAAVLLSTIAAACGGDDEPPATPRPPPSLAISSLSSAGGPTWTPAGGNCVAIGTDPAGTIVVSIALENFTLRPPGACGGIRPCGTAILMVDGNTVDRSSAATLSAPFADGDAGLSAGERSFRVELRDHLGDVVLDRDGMVIADEVVVQVESPGGCGGADASSDAPVDAADAGADAEPDAEPDAAVDAPSDAPPADASADASADATADVGAGDASDAGQG